MSITLNQFSVIHAQGFFSLCTIYGIENTKKIPPFYFIFIYNTDHIEFITFNNIWHILFAYFKTLKKKNIKALRCTARCIFGSNDKCTVFVLTKYLTFFYNISGNLLMWETILERLSLPWNPMMKIWYEAPVVSNKSHWPLVSTDNRSGNSDVWEDLTHFCGCVALVAFPVAFSDTVSVPHWDFAAVTTDMNSARVSRPTVVSEQSPC